MVHLVEELPVGGGVEWEATDEQLDTHPHPRAHIRVREAHTTPTKVGLWEDVARHGELWREGVPG